MYQDDTKYYTSLIFTVTFYVVILAATILGTIQIITHRVSKAEAVREVIYFVQGDNVNWDNLMLKAPLLSVEVVKAVKDPEWQKLRGELHYKTMLVRYLELERYLQERKHSREAHVQVTNYINALKRAGMIKEDE